MKWSRMFMVMPALLLMAAPAWSQLSIEVDGATPSIAPDKIPVEQIVRLHLRYRNLTDSTYVSSNAFRVYSPDGATWAPSGQVGNIVFTSPNNTGVQADSTGLITKADAELVFHIQGHGCDGLGDDTVDAAFVSTKANGAVRPHLDGRVLSLVVYTGGPENLGKHICIDSVMQYPLTNKWEWYRVFPNPPSPTSIIPDWNGPVCFEIVSTGLPPNLTNVPAEITGEHCTGVISYDFDAIDPEGDPITWRLLDGPGSIDDVTGIWTAEDLTPGSYSITVEASNSLTGGSSATVPVNITNAPPVGTAPGGTYTAFSGYPVKRQVTAADTCDTYTFSFLESGGPAGLLTLDSGDIVTFTPEPADAGDLTILMRVTDQYGAADTVDLNYDVIVCGVNVGNVDCDAENKIDIGDLTRLIDFLYLSFDPLCAGGKAEEKATPVRAVKK